MSTDHSRGSHRFSDRMRSDSGQADAQTGSSMARRWRGPPEGGPAAGFQSRLFGSSVKVIEVEGAPTQCTSSRYYDQDSGRKGLSKGYFASRQPDNDRR